MKRMAAGSVLSLCLALLLSGCGCPCDVKDCPSNKQEGVTEEVIQTEEPMNVALNDGAMNDAAACGCPCEQSPAEKQEQVIA
jgi:hypothetical protein